MLVEPGSESDRGRARKIMEALEACPDGLSAPQLLDMIDVPATSHQQALTKIGNLLRHQLKNGRVQQSGEVPGTWQRGPAVVWTLTRDGRAWLGLRRAGMRAAGQATLQDDPEGDAAIGRLAAAVAGLAAVRALVEANAAAIAPRLGRRQTAALMGVLRDGGFDLAEIAAVTGIGRSSVQYHLALQGKARRRAVTGGERGRTLAG